VIIDLDDDNPALALALNKKDHFDLGIKFLGKIFGFKIVEGIDGVKRGLSRLITVRRFSTAPCRLSFDFAFYPELGICSGHLANVF